MTTAIASLDKPMRHEARAYCERVGITDFDEVERVRLSMCHREFQRRMQPWNEAAARMIAHLPVGVEIPEETRQMLHRIGEQTARDLGLSTEPYTSP